MLQDARARNAAQKEQQKKGCAGCLAVVIVGFILFWIIGTINSSSENDSREEADKRIFEVGRETFGPNNSLVRKLKSLSQNTAYMIGFQDGQQDTASVFKTFARSGNAPTNSKLEEFRQLKLQILVDVIPTYNHIDPAVMSEYTRGWREGSRAVRQE